MLFGLFGHYVYTLGLLRHHIRFFIFIKMRFLKCNRLLFTIFSTTKSFGNSAFSRVAVLILEWNCLCSGANFTAGRRLWFRCLRRWEITRLNNWWRIPTHLFRRACDLSGTKILTGLSFTLYSQPLSATLQLIRYKQYVTVTKMCFCSNQSY